MINKFLSLISFEIISSILFSKFFKSFSDSIFCILIISDIILWKILSKNICILGILLIFNSLSNKSQSFWIISNNDIESIKILFNSSCFILFNIFKKYINP